MKLHAKRNSLAFLVFALLFSFQINGFSQNSILQRKITIYAENKHVEELLDMISKKGRFYFSYNSEIVQKDKVIPALKEKNATIKSLLDKVLGDDIEAVETGKYLILRSISKKKEQESKPSENVVHEKRRKYVITGYIINSQTGEKLSNATVYEIGKTNSVLTNPEGHYRITISTKDDNLGLAYSRRNFKDTVIIIQPANHSINMRLRPAEPIPEQVETKGFPKVNAKLDSIPELEDLGLVKFAVKKRQFSLSKNLKFLEKQSFQVSFIPGIGTNKLMSGNVENNFSLNILGGYSYAVKGVEIGSLLNIVRNDVKWAQVSGFANFVGGNTKGVQIAGFMNNNRKSVKGIQIAGFSNIVLDTITGIQISGFSNVLKGRMNGLQLSGFSNVTTENVDGIQLSGFNNYARKDVRFAQVTGFANYGHNVGGLQIAGFANVGNDIGGAQVAGFMNISSGEVGGAQIAGFGNIASQVNSAQIAGFFNFSTKEITGLQLSTFNIAKKVKGCQLGFINVADSVSGLSIGFLSVVRQGIHKFELSLNENLYANLSFKTGTHRFYNIFTAGMSIETNDYWTFGYGIGTEFRSKGRFYFDFDIISSYVNENFDEFNINIHNKIDTHFGWKVFKSSGIAFGPSLNIFVTDWRNMEGEFLTRFAPYELFKIANNNIQVSGWIGASIVIRL